VSIKSSSTLRKGGREFLPTRQSLLSRLKNYDDSASWEDFFNTYWKLIYGVAIKSGLTEIEAQEVVQETIIAVSKKMPGFKYNPAIGSFKAWLLNQTRWRIKDQFRKRVRELTVQPSGEGSSEEGRFIETFPDPAQSDLQIIWEDEWQQHILQTAMNRIKPKVSARQYQIFDLYVNKKWAVEKIQKTLGVTATQVYLAKHRIASLMREEIRKLEN
jgi:RNA polymerase sigma factor (sigma-70 family)